MKWALSPPWMTAAVAVIGMMLFPDIDWFTIVVDAAIVTVILNAIVAQWADFLSRLSESNQAHGNHDELCDHDLSPATNTHKHDMGQTVPPSHSANSFHDNPVIHPSVSMPPSLTSMTAVSPASPLAPGDCTHSTRSCVSPIITPNESNKAPLERGSPESLAEPTMSSLFRYGQQRQHVYNRQRQPKPTATMSTPVHWRRSMGDFSAFTSPPALSPSLSINSSSSSSSITTSFTNDLIRLRRLSRVDDIIRQFESGKPMIPRRRYSVGSVPYEKRVDSAFKRSFDVRPVIGMWEKRIAESSRA